MMDPSEIIVLVDCFFIRDFLEAAGSVFNSVINDEALPFDRSTELLSLLESLSVVALRISTTLARRTG